MFKDSRSIRRASIESHTDSLNESGHVESTIRAINGRSIHTYHTEGAGGGHTPDIMEIAKEGYVMPGSTTPTQPFTINTSESNLEMVFEAPPFGPERPG